jgi:phage-related protein
MAQGIASSRAASDWGRHQSRAVSLAFGMPLVRKLTGKVWEVRTQLPTRIARVLFTVKGQHMVLLHGFIKKTQATPVQDIELAEKRIDF